MTDEELSASADAIFDEIANVVAGNEELPKPSNS
jgi:hypothetical protein